MGLKALRNTLRNRHHNAAFRCRRAALCHAMTLCRQPLSSTLLSVLTQCWLIADSQREATIDGDGLPCHVFGLGEVDHQLPHVLRGLGDSLG